jgi:mono/diheme cytochrome c family protein
MKESLIVLAVVICVIVVIAVWRQIGGPASTDGGAIVSVNVPRSLSDVAERGKPLFEEACAQCHGANAGGSAEGPPLIHRIYAPNHHADLAFVLAARTGVRQHHWNFGNMQPIAAIEESDLLKIVAYVRALQRANGIQ